MRVGFIYRLYCLDADVKECYIGSCWKIKKRVTGHKSNCSNINRKDYNSKVYTFIRANGGWQNFDYEYFMVNVIDTTDLKMKEQDRMDIEINILLNEVRAYTHSAEYNKKYLKQYRINNKESLKLYKKQYRINNKQKTNKKYSCDCGGKYTHHNKSNHFKTLRHRCFDIMLHA